jgi:hypothetical protein
VCLMTAPALYCQLTTGVLGFCLPACPAADRIFAVAVQDIGRSLSWSRCAPSWRRLARQFELAFGMFWSAPFEAQLLALLAMGHPRLFGIVRAEAASKEGC